MRKIIRIEVASEFGAGTRGASMGPDALRMAMINKHYEFFNADDTIRIYGDIDRLGSDIRHVNAKRIKFIQELQNRIANSVSETLNDGNFPFVFSGDHSNAAATIAGIRRANPDKKIGVVWIDAHGDLHSPWTTPTGNIHGMPLAMALDRTHEEMQSQVPSESVQQAWADLCGLSGYRPSINPEDIFFIGIRDLEEQEWKIINDEKIRYFDADDVNHKGTENVMKEVLDYFDSHDLIYVSFDVDSLDSALVPGTGTPVENGLSFEQAKYLLESFWRNEKLACLEITEINPLLDRENETAELVADLIKYLYQ